MDGGRGSFIRGNTLGLSAPSPGPPEPSLLMDLWCSDAQMSLAPGCALEPLQALAAAPETAGGTAEVGGWGRAWGGAAS